jgi:hypothetical protein
MTLHRRLAKLEQLAAATHREPWWFPCEWASDQMDGQGRDKREAWFAEHRVDCPDCIAIVGFETIADMVLAVAKAKDAERAAQGDAG